MKPSTIKITYWILTSIFALFMLLDAYGGLTRQQAGVDAMQALGYPVYILNIVGFAKLLGAIAILQTKYQTIKEWAFAGFAINFIGAGASIAYVGNIVGISFPLIALVILFAVYFFWKKYETVKNIQTIRSVLVH